MKERKFVKLRIDMYEDTKFKIIDTMEERDLIHYIWSRIIILAGKVNLEGDLYLSRNIAYTIETLSIEFNRNAMKVKLALNTLINLEMIELVQGKVYRVKNFAKHQNIKIKEKVEIKENVEIKEEVEVGSNKVEIEYNTGNIKNKAEIQHNTEAVRDKGEKSIKEQLYEDKKAKLEHKSCENIDKVPENKVIVDKSMNSENIKENNFKNEVQINTPISIGNKKPQKGRGGRSKNIICIDGFEGENKQEEEITGFYDGEYNMPLGKGEKVIMSFKV